MSDLDLRTIQEINRELENISEEQSKLFQQEEKLNAEKNKLLAKEVLDSKIFNKCKWIVEKRPFMSYEGFIIRPTIPILFDELQSKLDLYPHGYFKMNDNIELIRSDGYLYIKSYDIKAGIEFIKSNDIEIILSELADEISSMEITIAKLKEFASQFDI